MILARLPDDAQRALTALLREDVRPYETADGMRFPGVSLLVSGRRG